MAGQAYRGRDISLKAPVKLPRILTVAEIQTILYACTRLRDRFFFAVLHETGCQAGEAFGLRHEDIAAAEREICIVPRENANGARAKSGGRTVPAGGELIRLYADYLHHEYGDVDSDYVFINIWAEPRRQAWSYPAAYDLVHAAAREDRHGFRPALVPALGGHTVAKTRSCIRCNVPRRREDGAVRDGGPGLAGWRSRRQSETAGQVAVTGQCRATCQDVAATLVASEASMMRQEQRKTQRRGQRPPPAGRHADLFSMVGKPLPTSLNRDAPQHVVQKILDHDSPPMTAHYARLSDKTVRDHWEKARKVDASGAARQDKPGGPLGDAAWAKHHLSRATQALPSGYCQLLPGPERQVQGGLIGKGVEHERIARTAEYRDEPGGDGEGSHSPPPSAAASGGPRPDRGALLLSHSGVHILPRSALSGGQFAVMV